MKVHTFEFHNIAIAVDRSMRLVAVGIFATRARADRGCIECAGEPPPLQVAISDATWKRHLVRARRANQCPKTYFSEVLLKYVDEREIAWSQLSNALMKVSTTLSEMA